jgi:subtilisin family serine protease
MRTPSVSRSLPGATAAALLALLAACTPDAGILEPSTASLGRSEREAAAPTAGAVVPNRYVVVLNDEARAGLDGIKEVIAKQGGEVHYVYQHALRGFAATLPPQAVADLERHPDVRLIEPDQTVTVAQTTQGNATWGLDRVDQIYRPLNSLYQYGRTGAGVNVYVLDTGIQTAHAQFGGRASAGYDAFGGNAQDCHGHGTHVAGTIGGSTWGVAKLVSLIAVRVLDCSGGGELTNPPLGYTSTIIAGVDWVTGHHTFGPAVVNMSIKSFAGQATDIAVNGMINDGVVAVAAAANDAADACGYTPARVPAAITVGATTATDARASWSNFGTCVDIFAPGESITSAALNGGSTAMSGTSMAAPHVAGGAALVLQALPAASPGVVAAALNSRAAYNQLSGIGTGSPNRLLNTVRLSAKVGYRAHVANQGWLADVYDYQVAGTTGQARRMEALTVELVNAPAGVGVAYQAHLKGTGWQSVRYNGQVAGTTGQSRRIEAVKIWLTNAPPGMGICYRVHAKNLGWMNEVCDGSQAGTTGQSRRIEAIQIRVYP